MLNARHSELHELVARWFAEELPEWVLAPEVSFAIYGERGVIDILAWHEPTRSLLVIELKTAIADVNELLGTMDRKKRLAAQVARDRGWDPLTVSQWLIVADTRTNRRRLDAHMTVIRNAFPGRHVGHAPLAATAQGYDRRRDGLGEQDGGRVSEQGWQAFLDADGVDDWVVLHGGATAVFRVRTAREAARLAEAIADVPGIEGSGTLMTIRDGTLTVRLTRDLWWLEPRHVELAKAVSASPERTARSRDRAAVA